MTVLAIDATFQLHRMKFVAANTARAKAQRYVAGGMDPNQASLKAVKEEANHRSIAWLLFRSLVPMMERFQPSQVVYLWDEGECTHRVNLFNDYKGDRAVRGEEPELISRLLHVSFQQARSYIYERFPKIGVANIKVPGVEADDWGYFMANHLSNVVLVSDDKDWNLNLTIGSRLFRPMSKAEPDRPLSRERTPQDNGPGEILHWDEFDRITNWEHYAGNTEFKHVAPRLRYMYHKACVGGKDNIERITTPAPAKKMADHIIGVRESTDKKILDLIESSKDHLARNLKLADTSWITKLPEVDAHNVYRRAIDEIVVGDEESFRLFCYELRLHGNYQDRWKLISERLVK